MSINDDENFTYSIKLICLKVFRFKNCTSARIIYSEIFMKMLSGSLEVSSSIYTCIYCKTKINFVYQSQMDFSVMNTL